MRVETPVNTGTKTGVKTGRAWRQVTGPPGSSMTPRALHLATIFEPEQFTRFSRLETEQKATVEAHLAIRAAERKAREAEREVLYIEAVRRFRDHGYGKPVAAPAIRSPVSCDWVPASNISPSDVPSIPEFLRRVWRA